MTTIEGMTTPPPGLEERITESFEGGQRLCRELRLSEAEAGYVARTYAALLRPMGEQWYEITFQGAMKNGN